MADPRKLFESRDMEGAILYVKRVTGDNEAWPLLASADGSLLVTITAGTITVDTAGLATSVGQTTHTTLLTEISSAVRGQLTIGTVTLNTTAVTVSNPVGNPVNVSLTSTVVSVTFPPSLSTTDVTINNLAANPVQVALTSTVVTVKSAVAGFNVNIATATLGTVTVALSSTEVTVKSAVAGFNVNIATATLGTVTTSLSSTIVTAQISSASSVVTVHISPTASVVTVKSSVAGFNVNIATATLGTVTTSLASTAVSISTAVTYSTIMLVSKTLTGSTGSVSTTNTSISVTPSGRVKVYAFSLTTTVTTSLICVFHSGSVANGLELWRVLLQAPSGASAGANLAVAPPAFLFASRSGTAVSLSLSTAAIVHYSLSYYDEA